MAPLPALRGNRYESRSWCSVFNRNLLSRTQSAAKSLSPVSIDVPTILTANVSLFENNCPLRIPPSGRFGHTAADHCLLSDQPALGQRHALSIADDDVIEQTNIHQRQGLFNSLGDELVSLRRFGDTARMIMRNDDGRGIAL